MTPIPFQPRTVLIGIAALAATTLSASPASAMPGATGCPTVAVTQPFAPWMDDADYVLAPDGDLEDGGAAWTLTGGAAVVQSTGGLGTGQRALSLPAGSSATTAPMCIGAEHRTIRFFARNDDGSDGSLRVAARFTTPGGQTESVRVGDVREGTSWSPTEAFDSIVNRMAVAQENAMTVSWQFTPRGETRWSIDDVYIDPFRT